MATMNIELEVPNTMVWTREQLVSAVKAFVSAFATSFPMTAAVDSRTKTAEHEVTAELPISDFVRNIGLPMELPATYDVKEEYHTHLAKKYS